MSGGEGDAVEVAQDGALDLLAVGRHDLTLLHSSPSCSPRTWTSSGATTTAVGAGVLLFPASSLRLSRDIGSSLGCVVTILVVQARVRGHVLLSPSERLPVHASPRRHSLVPGTHAPLPARSGTTRDQGVPGTATTGRNTVMWTTDGQRGPEIWIRGPVAAPEPVPMPYASTAAPRRFSWVCYARRGRRLHARRGLRRPRLRTLRGRAPGILRPPLLVARTHAAGLDSVPRGPRGLSGAARFMEGSTWTRWCFVADAPGRLPRPLVQRVKVIESVVDVHCVPVGDELACPGELAGGPPRETELPSRLTGAPTH